MALTPTQRPTREWPLLLLTVALVGFICFPLAQGLLPEGYALSQFAGWDSERWARLLFGAEQIACYCCCIWASLILLSRYLELRRQRRAFDLPLLLAEGGARILRIAARRPERELDAVVALKGLFILNSLIRIMRGKLRVSHACPGLGDTVRTRAEVDQGRLVTTMATVH